MWISLNKYHVKNCEIWWNLIFWCSVKGKSVSVRQAEISSRESRIIKNWKPTSEYVEDNHRKNTPSSKTQAFTGSMNMDIWEIGTLIQLFIYLLKFNFQKKDG